MKHLPGPNSGWRGRGRECTSPSGPEIWLACRLVRTEHGDTTAPLGVVCFAAMTPLRSAPRALPLAARASALLAASSAAAACAPSSASATRHLASGSAHAAACAVVAACILSSERSAFRAHFRVAPDDVIPWRKALTWASRW